MQKRRDVVILGGGIAGLTAALNLAQRGVAVTLVERDAALGGQALLVGCKAVDGKCQLCGGCLLQDRLAAVRADDRISIRTKAALRHLARARAGFDVVLSSVPGVDPPTFAHADAIIVATGFDHVDARTKGPYGHGTLPAVVTGSELEKRLVAEGQGAFDGLGLRQVAFVQCVGSRDDHVGRGYCSQVCCRYALRLARLLKSRLPQVEVTIFKMDIQTSGRDFAPTWSACQSEGFRLIAGLPAVVRRCPDDPVRATFAYDDVLAGRLAEEDVDLLVLSVGIQPRHDAGQVAELLGINRDAFGFFAAGADRVGTINPGVFVAGSCQAPRSMAESMAHAQRAAEACYLYLQEKGS